MTSHCSEVLSSIAAVVRDTPLRPLGGSLVKCEFQLPYSGSTKDRSVLAVLEDGIASGALMEGGTVIEASSGNFAVACALMCSQMGIKFIPVLDGHVNSTTLRLLSLLCEQVELLPAEDGRGKSALERRRDRVREIVRTRSDCWWPDQYTNMSPVRAHSEGTFKEIVDAVPDVEEIVVAVGTGGTLAGIAKGLIGHDRHIKLVAVDVIGSEIFGGSAGPRHIPGMGSSLRSALVDRFSHRVDEVVMVAETDIVRECRRLAQYEGLFVGGSAGAVSLAATLREDEGRRKRVIIAPDRGLPYLDTIFSDSWVRARYDTDALV
ncbi:cysteine synthase A [Curtobacterium sp. PhB142]|nr:cysteine synthase A [Curtobacterium sp. PhB142]TCM04189.1 cysteine synthase A [Curtobacterium sp. PhB134]